MEIGSGRSYIYRGMPTSVHFPLFSGIGVPDAIILRTMDIWHTAMAANFKKCVREALFFDEWRENV